MTARQVLLSAALLVLAAGCGGGGGAGAPLVAAGGGAGGSHVAGAGRIAAAAGRTERSGAASGRSTLAVNTPPNTTTADPPVPRPHTAPCTVPLFTGTQFADFSTKQYQFVPPAACPRPWSKVVLEGDFAVSAGRQFDRTATIALGGANIYFGTTAEPSRALGPSWHVERDLTDYSALFAAPHPGAVSIGNLVNGTYTGIITGSAKLDFYPAGEDAPAPRVADVVIPVTTDPNGNPTALGNSQRTLAVSFVPPTNVVEAYLDVISQSQQGDEFWYTCVPNDAANALQSCGGGSFRENEIAVDGMPAGVAPVYPWIYTGGIDPYLWRPIPGVQTLNFKPFRVDVSPFAGVLDNGASHTVALSVAGANNYFSSVATLLLYLDRDAKHPLRGGIETNTLSAVPPQSVREGFTTDKSGNISGPVDDTSSRSFTISGYVRGDDGGIRRSSVQQTMSFSNHQVFTITPTVYDQVITQRTNVTTISTHERGNDRNRRVIDRATYAFPLDLAYGFTIAPDGSAAQTTTVNQAYVVDRSRSGEDELSSHVSNVVNSTDTLQFDPSGALTGIANTKSSQTYGYRNSRGACYQRSITSANLLLTSDVRGC